jgi:hypothetical protein
LVQIDAGVDDPFVVANGKEVMVQPCDSGQGVSYFATD